MFFDNIENKTNLPPENQIPDSTISKSKNRVSKRSLALLSAWLICFSLAGSAIFLAGKNNVLKFKADTNSGKSLFTKDSTNHFTSSRPFSVCWETPADPGSSTSIIDSCDVILKNSGTNIRSLQDQGKYVLAIMKWGNLTNGECALDVGGDIPNDKIDSCSASLTFQMINRVRSNGFNGIAFSEFTDDNTKLKFFQAVAKAIAGFKQAPDQTNQPTFNQNNKIVFVFGRDTVPTDQNYQTTLGQIIKDADYYLPEIYEPNYYNIESSQSAYDFLKETYSKAFDDSITDFYKYLKSAAFPNNSSKLIPAIGLADSTNSFTYDLSPYTSYPKSVELQLSLVRDRIKVSSDKKFNGVALYTPSYGTKETLTSLAKSLIQYFPHMLPWISNTPFSAEGLVLPLANPGFEDVNDTSWKQAQGNKQMVYVNTQSQGLDWLYDRDSDGKLVKFGKKPVVPERFTALKLTRGSIANIVKQKVNLAVGKSYKLTVYSKKIADYQNSQLYLDQSGATALVLDGNGSKFDLASNNTKGFYLKYLRDAAEYSQLPIGCSGTTNCQLWTKQTITFIAPTEQVIIRLSDENANEGDVNILDFVKLEQIDL